LHSVIETQYQDRLKYNISLLNNCFRNGCQKSRCHSEHKKLSYCRWSAWRTTSAEILSTATRRYVKQWYTLTSLSRRHVTPCIV